MISSKLEAVLTTTAPPALSLASTHCHLPAPCLDKAEDVFWQFLVLRFDLVGVEQQILQSFIDAEMHFFGFLLASVGLWLLPVTAETVLREQIWGSVVFTLYGDRTPLVLNEAYTLTPLGAQQLYAGGSAFRNRYVTPRTSAFGAFSVSTEINGISEYQLDNDEVTMESTTEQYVVASAQAFLQGLYPPLSLSSNNTFATSQSSLANGTNVLGPLYGYQYPQVYTASVNDENMIWIAGDISCPAYTSARTDYYTSAEYSVLENSTAAFYASLQPDFLDGIFTTSSVGYYDAYYIWDYLQYGYTHNTSIADHINYDDLVQARTLASQMSFALNGNTAGSGSTIGGATLATRVMEALYTNIESSGENDKLTLLFGSFEPMISFAALAGLASEQDALFYSLPDPGSSMVFELFSLSANDSDGYPDQVDLNVRFLFQNGTGDNAELISYSLFGQDPSLDTMSLQDFIDGMENIWMPSVPNWCDTCESFATFCPASGTDGGVGSSSGSNCNSSSSSHHGISAPLAGVIGAIVTLITAGLVAAVLAILGGLRVHRVQRKSRSDLHGFKGGEKLASDADLTLANNGAEAAVTSVNPPPDRLRERVGSWEMGSQAKAEERHLANIGSTTVPARRASFEEDELHVSPFASPVSPDDKV